MGIAQSKVGHSEGMFKRGIRRSLLKQKSDTTANRPERRTKLKRSASVLSSHILTHQHSFRENMVSHSEEDIWKEYEVVEDAAGGVLGAGVCGKVYKVRRRNMNQALYAMKTIKTKNMTVRHLKELQTEVEVLKLVNHSHIARLYESFETVGSKVRSFIWLLPFATVTRS